MRYFHIFLRGVIILVLTSACDVNQYLGCDEIVSVVVVGENEVSLAGETLSLTALEPKLEQLAEDCGGTLHVNVGSAVPDQRSTVDAVVHIVFSSKWVGVVSVSAVKKLK